MCIINSLLISIKSSSFHHKAFTLVYVFIFISHKSIDLETMREDFVKIFRLCNRAKCLWIWNWNTSCWFLDVVCSGTVLPQLLLLHIFWKQSIYWIRTLGVFFLTLNKPYHTENHGYSIDRVIPPFFLFLINDLTGFKKNNFLWW